MSKHKILQTLKAICKHGVYQSLEKRFIKYPDTKKWVEKTRNSRLFFRPTSRCLDINNETLGKVLNILKTFKVIPQCLIWEPANVYVVVNFLPQVNFIFTL